MGPYQQGTPMTPTMAAIKACTLLWWSYYIWDGPQNIRGWELHRIKKDIVLLGILYRHQQKRRVNR